MSYALARPAGFSPAGRRILAAGLAFQRAQEPHAQAPSPPEPEVEVSPPVAPLTGIERVKFDALVQRIQVVLDCRDIEEPPPKLSLATIIAGIKSIKARMQDDNSLAEKYADLKAMLEVAA